MSVQLSSCGQLGWVSDEQGYAYKSIDPYTTQPWPAIPDVMMQLAQRAAAQAGFHNFQPDTCLINRYEADSKLSLHQDKNEIDFTQPIVSVSLGIPAIFLLGGFSRQAETQRLLLQHGDVMVWGGVDRMRFHGVMPIKPAWHEQLGALRINLTFRRAG
jgi:alkylated DNA repair protein (DNA oxidative demethylase)